MGSQSCSLHIKCWTVECLVVVVSVLTTESINECIGTGINRCYLGQEKRVYSQFIKNHFGPLFRSVTQNRCMLAFVSVTV